MGENLKVSSEMLFCNIRKVYVHLSQQQDNKA